MKLIEVVDKKTQKDFLDVPRILYRNDPNWIAPLNLDIESTFDREKNAYYKKGDAIRWLLADDNGKLIGRVAAFYYKPDADDNGVRSGGMGFFECINDKKAAFTLFNACSKWLSGKGMTVVDGPVNFGERDRFWGLLVQGFNQPSYMENYNPPYYQKFFEDYGFVNFFEQSTSEIRKKDFNYERISKIAGRVLNNPVYRFEHFKESELKRFAGDFIKIYNEAWARHDNFMPMTYERIEKIMKSMLPIIIEEFVWFVYANDEPVGFYINLIDVNEIFKHLNGKLDLWGKIKFLWFKKVTKPKRVRGIVFGVIPRYQNLGLETGMIIKLYEYVNQYPSIQSSELSWIGDFNPKMHSMFRAIGAHTVKRHITYRKLLDDNLQFERSKVLV